jgi:hypothetical protein
MSTPSSALGPPDQDGVLSAPGGDLVEVDSGGRIRRRLRAGGFGLAKAAAVARHGLLDVLGEVVPQVPAVGDLDGLGCASMGAVGVGAGAVAAHDLDAGVLAQPVGEGVGLPVSQQLHRAVAGHVDQDAAVVVAAAQREVVDAEHGHRVGLGIGQRAEQAQQGTAADRQPKRGGQPCPGAARQRQTDLLQHPARQRAAASVGRGQARDLLGEGARPAAWGVAEEPADPQPDQHLLAADGRVGQRALIPAVDLGRRVTAPVAPGASGAWDGPDPHAAASLLDLLDGYVCQVRKEVVESLVFTCRAWWLALLPTWGRFDHGKWARTTTSS